MGVAELCVKSKNIKIEELKCMHRGDKYHEVSYNMVIQ